MNTLSVNFPCPVCKTEHTFQVTPARQAPACSNPNSPAFSDSGDPAEVNGPDECENCQHNFEEDWEAIEEKAYDEYLPDYDPLENEDYDEYPEKDFFEDTFSPPPSPEGPHDFVM